MAKQTSVYFCQECGHESAKWLGQCPACKSWNSFVEEPVRSTTAGGKRGAGGYASGNLSTMKGGNGTPGSGGRPQKLQEISTEQEERTGCRIHLKLVFDNGTETIDRFAHICIAADNVDFFEAGDIT